MSIKSVDTITQAKPHPSYQMNRFDKQTISQLFTIICDDIALHKFSDEKTERLHRRINEDGKDQAIIFDFFVYYYAMKLRGEL